jgi:hypothetical protein
MTIEPTSRSARAARRRPPIRVRTVLLLVALGAALGIRVYRRRTLRRNAEAFYATYGRP